MRNITELDSYLKNWQEKINLIDWNLSIELTNFTRTDYIQTGDIKVDTINKKAIVLISNEDTGVDVNMVILHELVHLLIWDLDHFCEDNIQNKAKYFTLLEQTVGDITDRLFDSFNSREKIK